MLLRATLGAVGMLVLWTGSILAAEEIGTRMPWSHRSPNVASPSPWDTAAVAQDRRTARAVDRLAARHACSSRGLSRGVIPVRTLVRTTDGEVRTAPFEVG